MVVTYKQRYHIAPRPLGFSPSRYLKSKTIENLQLDIKVLLKEGKSVKQIAEDLGRSVPCVKTQIWRMGIKIRENKDLTK